MKAHSTSGNLSWYRAPRAAAVLVVAPALGIAGRHYAALATALAARGISVLVLDYRNADGRVLHDWGAVDLEQALQAARRESARVFVLGHSLGAQIWGLAPSAAGLSGLILLAASAPHYRHWHGAARWKLIFAWYLLVPVLTALAAQVSLRWLGLSRSRVPAGVLRQWAAWARRPNYLFDALPRAQTAVYRTLAVPTLCWSFTDDALAPPAAVAALLAQCPRLALTRRHVSPAERGLSAIGHAGFLKPEAAPLWQDTADWLLAAADTPSRN